MSLLQYCIAGANINAQTEETQETALTLACCGGFTDVADFLIKAGADIELGASTPLMEAAQEGHLELVKCVFILLLKLNELIIALFAYKCASRQLPLLLRMLGEIFMVNHKVSPSAGCGSTASAICGNVSIFNKDYISRMNIL